MLLAWCCKSFTIIFFVVVVVSLAGPLPPPQASAAAPNFSFPSIGTNQGGTFMLTREAYITTEGIQLTPNERNQSQIEKSGQATYPTPLHLWDKTTGNLAGFETNFSFVINSLGNNNYGDGLAFFLVPNGSVFPDVIGGGFGLTNTTNISDLNFLAVEFDTFFNSGWDPPERTTHVGIDHNTVQSVNYSVWGNAIRTGKTMNAWISYHPVSQLLTVVFSNYSTDTLSFPDSNATLTYNVDLRNWLPEWVSFGFTAATGALFQTNTIKSWSFNSNDIQPPTPTPPPPPPPTPTPTPTTPPPAVNKVVWLAVGLSTSLFIIIIILAWIIMRRRRKNKNKKPVKKKEEEEEDEEVVAIKDFNIIDDEELDKGNGPRRFSYDELCVATNYFSKEQKLGEGGFGSVYRGLLKISDQGGTHNLDMAVKKVSANSKQGVKEYLSEVRIISKLRHRNLVQLLGWCHEKRELLLAYEFLSNGSLDQHIYNSKTSSTLDWPTRIRIARGLASALLYLHEEWEQCVVHRDVKSSNVMLDSSFNPKLGDFGLARFVDHGKQSQTTVPAGTLGYMAPECYTTGQANKESDVFSFGIVALEIASGRKPIYHSAEGPFNVRLVEWIWGLYGSGELLTAVDPKLCDDFIESQLVRLMIVGLWCAHPDCDLRPSIRQAMLVLNFEAPLPVLPAKMPVPMYCSTPPAPLGNYEISISTSISGPSNDGAAGQTGSSYNSTTTTTISSSSISS